MSRTRAGPLRSRSPHFIRSAFLASTAALVLAACATAPVPVRPLADGDPQARSLLEGLVETAQRRESLRGIASLSIDGVVGSGRAKQIFVMQRPARLRVEVIGFLSQTLAVLATDGKRYEIFRAQQRGIERGAVHPGLLWQFAGIALTPEQAVQVLLGAPPVPDDAEVLGGEHLPDGGLRLRVVGASTPAEFVLDFDSAGQLRRWTVTRPDGSEVWDVGFDEYRETDGDAFPHRIDLRDHVTGSRARISFGKIELNPDLVPGVFRLSGGGVG